MGANVSDNKGAATWIFHRKLGIWAVRAPHRILFDMDSRASAQWGRQKDRPAISTISVIDLRRRCTVWKFPINQRSDDASGNIFSALRQSVWQHGGPKHDYFPRKLAIWKVRTPNIALVDVDSRAGIRVGIARKFGAQNRPFQ